MLNRIFKISTLMALALVFVMTSCQKENLEELTTENFTQQEDGQRGPMMSHKGGKKGKKGGKCFKPVFPFTFNFPDGSAVEVADREAAKEALEAWKTANPDATERPSIAMPYDVALKDGTTATITSEEDLAALKETCEPRGDRGRRCFKPVFPFTINFPDGSSATVNDKEEAKAAKDEWKAANPDATERPSIAMPFDVMLKDSSIVTIETEEDLEALKETCGPRDGRGGRCFKPVFPVTLNFPDGSSQEVEDKDAAKAALQTWKEANPDSEERPSIAFPHDVELTDGTVVTVENVEDAAALREGCEGQRGKRGNRPRPNGNG